MPLGPGKNKQQDRNTKLKLIQLSYTVDFSLKIPIPRLCLWFKSYPQPNFFAEFPSPGSTGNSFRGLSKARGICQSFLIFQLLDKTIRQWGHGKAKHPNHACAGLKKIERMYKRASSTGPAESVWLQKLFNTRNLVVSYFHFESCSQEQRFTLCWQVRNISLGFYFSQDKFKKHIENMRFSLLPPPHILAFP